MTVLTFQPFRYSRILEIKSLLFAGDRAADLLQLKESDVLRFLDNSGFLFNHIWTKSLRSGDYNVFAFKRGSNRSVCPIRGLEIYFRISRFLGIHSSPGFLFRTTTRANIVGSQYLEPSAAQVLSFTRALSFTPL